MKSLYVPGGPYEIIICTVVDLISVCTLVDLISVCTLVDLIRWWYVHWWVF